MKYLICNLKGNKTYEEMGKYIKEISKIKTDLNLIVAPSSIYLSMFKDTNITICSQDISLNSTLHLTGDMNIDTLNSLDVKYTIIGHFERRKFYNENINDIVTKIKIALNHNLKVIYCIGESLEELSRHVEYQVLEKNIARVFNQIPENYLDNIIIAYEPNYLICNNYNYNISKIKETITFINHLVYDYYGFEPEIVFGGSINPKNIDDFLNLPIAGFIIGNASLNPQNVSKIISKMAN